MVGEAESTALALRGVTVSLGGRAVLRDVGFSLRPGDVCGLVGSNGSGKTTLLRTVAGLVRADRGTITIGDRPRPGPIGYVPQRLGFDPAMPIRARDLVALGLDGHRLGIPLRSAARNRLVDEMLDAVEAGSFASRRIGELSGGQQGRVLIAHALIRRPGLLLLDEALAALDPRSVGAVVTLLRRLATDRKVAILLSTHDINPLLPAMDRIVYLAGGRAASGTVDAVVRTDVLSRLYGHHVDVIRVHGRILVVSGGDATEAERLVLDEPTHVERVP